MERKLFWIFTLKMEKEKKTWEEETNKGGTNEMKEAINN